MGHASHGNRATRFRQSHSACGVHLPRQGKTAVAGEHLGKVLLSLVDKYKRALQVGTQRRKEKHFSHRAH